MNYEFLNKGVATVDRIDDHAEYKDLVVSGIYVNTLCSKDLTSMTSNREEILISRNFGELRNCLNLTKENFTAASVEPPFR